MRDDLWEAVRRQPDDDAPRLVLADALIEHGDPRGEFIALQLRPEPWSRADLARQRRLLKLHEKEWLGPVALVTTKASRIWRRGFLDDCTFWPKRGQVPAAVGHPAWAGVRRFTLDATDGGARELLMHPVMRGLRFLHGGAEPVIEALAQASQPFAIEELSGAFIDDDGLWHSLLDPVGMPSLRTLQFTFWYGADDDPTKLRPIWKSRLGRQLDVLRLKLYPFYFRDWATEILAHAPMAVEIDLNAWMRIEKKRLVVWPSDSDLRASEIKTIVAESLKVLPAKRFDTVEIHDDLRSPSVDRQANRLRGR